MQVKYSASIAILLIFIQTGWSQTSVEQGWNLFNRCIQGKVPGKNFSQVLDSALEIFQKELVKPDYSKEAALGFMRCILLKGNQVKLDKKQKKAMYQLGEKKAKQALDKFPNDGDIIYWYIACLGRWTESMGIMKAARQGVADKVKALCEKLIKMNSKVMQARGHRILGRTHYKAPYVPLILTWPSNKKSIEHLKKSEKIDPASLSTLQFLAEVYYKEGNKKLALETIQKALKIKVREVYKLSDERRLKMCRKLYKKWSEK